MRKTARKTGRVSSEDWFRSADWGAAAQAEFEARLARARPHNRVQYRRIKALGLLGSGDGDREAAGYAMLAGIARNADAPHHEKVGALSFMGAHDQERGRLREAESNLRAALEAMKADQSGSTDLKRSDWPKSFSRSVVSKIWGKPMVCSRSER